MIYSPIGTGSKALASYTLSDISGTQIQFGGSVLTANSNTADDKEALTGSLSETIEGLTGKLEGTSTWDSSVQESEGSQYGQMATVVNSNEVDEVLYNPVAAGWPGINKMDYYHEPFHNDIIVAAPNAQFFMWEYPDGYFAMPVGSEPFFEATVDALAACASPGSYLARATVTASIAGDAMNVTAISGSIPLLSTVNGSGVAPGTTVVSFATETGTGSTTGTYNLSIPQNVASETMTTSPNPSDCAALLAVQPVRGAGFAGCPSARISPDRSKFCPDSRHASRSHQHLCQHRSNVDGEVQHLDKHTNERNDDLHHHCYSHQFQPGCGDSQSSGPGKRHGGSCQLFRDG